MPGKTDVRRSAAVSYNLRTQVLSETPVPIGAGPKPGEAFGRWTNHIAHIVKLCALFTYFAREKFQRKRRESSFFLLKTKQKVYKIIIKTTKIKYDVGGGKIIRNQSHTFIYIFNQLYRYGQIYCVHKIK